MGLGNALLYSDMDDSLMRHVVQLPRECPFRQK